MQCHSSWFKTETLQKIHTVISFFIKWQDQIADMILLCHMTRLGTTATKPQTALRTMRHVIILVVL